MKFQPGEKWNGNRKGRPRKPEVEVLRAALESARKEKGLHLIEHAVREAYNDSSLCAQVLKKILPDKLDIEDKKVRKIILIRYAKKEKCKKRKMVENGRE